MRTTDDEDKWPKAGRLDEHDPDVFGLKARPAPRTGHPLATFRRWSVSRRKTARCRPNSTVAVRIAATIPTLTNHSRLAPFHFAVTYHSRDRASWIQPLSCRTGRRVAVFPRAADELQKVRKAGGTYVKKCRVWTIKSDAQLLRTPQGEYLASGVAALKREGWRAGKSVTRSDRGAINFIRYIERLDRDEKAQLRDLDSDEKGLISFGNLGQTPALRQMHVEAVLDVERRHDARIQSRVIAEVPHWISAAERRLISQRFSEIFEKRGLGYWVALHRPDPNGDQRNFHLHVIYHDRPVIGHRVDFVQQPDGAVVTVQRGPIFSKNKDRSASGSNWIKFLRENYAEVVNEVLLARAHREQQAPPYFYFPGSYRDLGIETKPEIHLGPRQSALVRKGDITWREFHNLETQSEIFAQRERAATTIFENAHGQLNERIKSNDSDTDSVVAFLNVTLDAYAHTLEGLASIQEFQDEAPTTEAVVNILQVHQLDETRLRDFISFHRHEDDTEALLNLAYFCLLHRLEIAAAYFDAIVSGEKFLLVEDQLLSSDSAGDPIFVSPCDAAIARALGAREPSADHGWLIRPELNDAAKQRLVRLFCSPEARLYALVDRRVPWDAELAIETFDRAATIGSNRGGRPSQADQLQERVNAAAGALSGAAASGGASAIMQNVPTFSKAPIAARGEPFKQTREADARERDKACLLREKGAPIFKQQPTASERLSADMPGRVQTSWTPKDSLDRAKSGAPRCADEQMAAAALVFESKSANRADIVDLLKRANTLSSSLLRLAHYRTREAHENAKAAVRQHPGAATVEKMRGYEFGLAAIRKVALARGIELPLSEPPQIEATINTKRAKSARDQGR